jgi:hypothetical protein
MGRKQPKQSISLVVESPASTPRRLNRIVAGLFVLALVGGAGIIASRFQNNEDVAAASPPEPARKVAAPATAGPSQNALPEIELRNLVGRWRRTDANYVLQIKRVAPDGQIDAAYFNPRPIHVSKAVAASESGKTTVLIELNDRLYPGSYYTLTFSPSDDRLSGVYHHLGVHRNFDVVFVRVGRN